MLSRQEWMHRCNAALDWLIRSIEATGHRGSAHHFSPFWGWAPAYPETSGYLIETLLRFEAVFPEKQLREHALRLARWLPEVQLKDGAFPGGKTGRPYPAPSVFNTSQILFGLSACLPLETRPEVLESSIRRALVWLIEQLEADGAWRKAAYFEGFTPSYYTRAVWAVLVAGKSFQDLETKGFMREALGFYARRFLPNGAVQDWGFRPGEPAFTHTLAYTLEGFWESALVLQDMQMSEHVLRSAKALYHQVQQQGGRVAGRYDEQWRGDYSFACVTGLAQLSVLYARLAQQAQVPEFEQFADDLLQKAVDAQYLGEIKGAFGALPGSRPFWGPYLRFRYPNWAAKFFLDAMWMRRPALF